jgi:8-oxo-dGTP pyrophosphatase MutT (NUDIX family)
VSAPDPRVRHTLALLAAYRPALAEAEAYQGMLDLLGGTAAPLSRHQFDPGHFTAGGFVVGGDRSAVLMIEHRRLGRWLQPGGHIDLGDAHPEAAARREITEETGVADLAPLARGVFAVDVHPIPARADEPAHRHFDVLFTFVAGQESLRPSEEVVTARWVPLDEAGLLDVDEATLRAIIRLRSLLAGE